MAKLKIINDKKYLPVEELEKQNIYLGSIREMKQFCDCKGWGCIFCCRDYIEHLAKQGGGI